MIVVTAPTSNIGQQVLANILDTGEPIRVIARDPSRLPAHTRECVEVVQGSHSDLDVVSQAFTGADAVIDRLSGDRHIVRIQAPARDRSTRRSRRRWRERGWDRFPDRLLRWSGRWSLAE